MSMRAYGILHSLPEESVSVFFRELQSLNDRDASGRNMADPRNVLWIQTTEALELYIGIGVVPASPRLPYRVPALVALTSMANASLKTLRSNTLAEHPCSFVTFIAPLPQAPRRDASNNLVPAEPRLGDATPVQSPLEGANTATKSDYDGPERDVVQTEAEERTLILQRRLQILDGATASALSMPDHRTCYARKCVAAMNDVAESDCKNAPIVYSPCEATYEEATSRPADPSEWEAAKLPTATPPSTLILPPNGMRYLAEDILNDIREVGEGASKWYPALRHRSSATPTLSGQTAYAIHCLSSGMAGGRFRHPINPAQAQAVADALFVKRGLGGRMRCSTLADRYCDFTVPTPARTSAGKPTYGKYPTEKPEVAHPPSTTVQSPRFQSWQNGVLPLVWEALRQDAENATTPAQRTYRMGNDELLEALAYHCSITMNAVVTPTMLTAYVSGISSRTTPPPPHIASMVTSLYKFNATATIHRVFAGVLLGEDILQWAMQGNAELTTHGKRLAVALSDISLCEMSFSQQHTTSQGSVERMVKQKDITPAEVTAHQRDSAELDKEIRRLLDVVIKQDGNKDTRSIRFSCTAGNARILTTGNIEEAMRDSFDKTLVVVESVQTHGAQGSNVTVEFKLASLAHAAILSMSRWTATLLRNTNVDLKWLPGNAAPKACRTATLELRNNKPKLTPAQWTSLLIKRGHDICETRTEDSIRRADQREVEGGRRRRVDRIVIVTRTVEGMHCLLNDTEFAEGVRCTPYPYAEPVPRCINCAAIEHHVCRGVMPDKCNVCPAHLHVLPAHPFEVNADAFLQDRISSACAVQRGIQTYANMLWSQAIRTAVMHGGIYARHRHSHDFRLRLGWTLRTSFGARPRNRVHMPVIQPESTLADEQPHNSASTDAQGETAAT